MTADQADALLHAEEAEPALARAANPLDVEAAAVIDHAGKHRPGLARDRHIHMRGRGVLDNVGQRFLNDAVDHDLDLVWQALFHAARVEVDLDLGSALEIIGIPLQSGNKPQVVQSARAEIEGELSHLLENPSGLAPHLSDPCRQLLWGGTLLDHAEPDQQRGQRLRRLIVQFARDALAFLLLCRENLPRERADALAIDLQAVEHRIHRINELVNLGVAKGHMAGPRAEVPPAHCLDGALERHEGLEGGFEDNEVHQYTQGDARDGEEEN